MYQGGVQPKPGDLVRLGNNNGSGAFKALSSSKDYRVDALGTSCSHCGISLTGASIKILGRYYCAASFVAVAAQAAKAGQSGSTAEAKRDPARALYASDVDWFDCLPDATHEEMLNLPTLEQLYEWEQKKRSA